MDGDICTPILVGVRILDTDETEVCTTDIDSLRPSDLCVVETGHGLDVGEVVPCSPEQISLFHHKGMTWRVIRKATEDDRRAYQRKQESEARAWSYCIERARERSIALKLVRVHYLFDGTKAIFYYTADGRIDFRELVKDLARELRMKIEMRQIGVRDEARMVDGYGTCGRQLCCSAYLRGFEPVTLAMAKKQNTGCNPSTLTGLCGRLKCCLRNEWEPGETAGKGEDRRGT